MSKRSSLTPHLSILLALASAGAAHASAIVIPDIGAFSSYSTTNTSLTFSGTGFAGMYGAAQNGADEWVHVFGLEQTDVSRTIMQIDLTSLAGVTVNSAVLRYSLLSGAPGPHGIQVTSYNSDGTLRFAWDPPSNLGTATATDVHGVNSIDITSLVQSRLASSANWLGLELRGIDDNAYMWTYTNTNADAAHVRLAINEISMPEPGTWLLLASGFVGLIYYRRRANAAAH